LSGVGTAGERMLQRDYLAVLEVSTRDELQAELVRFTRQLGFQTVTGTTVVDHLLGEPEFVSVENAPAAYRESIRDPDRDKRDPVGQHCRTNSLPIVWDQSTYTNSGTGELWEHQAQFGYRHGISVALHLPRGRHLWLGVDRDQALPSCVAEVTRMTAGLQLLAVHAQEAAMRVLLPEAIPEKDPGRLTPPRAGMPVLDDGRQDRLGAGSHPRHLGSDGRSAPLQRVKEARLREQTSGGVVGLAPEAHLVTSPLARHAG
jgi:Autoinducer binding domain